MREFAGSIARSRPGSHITARPSGAPVRRPQTCRRRRAARSDRVKRRPAPPGRRSRERRPGRCPEVPAISAPRPTAPRRPSNRPRGLLPRRRPGSYRNVARRHLRPRRRRLRALFRRRALAGAAFRENALRQRAHSRPPDRSVAAHRQRTVPDPNRGDRLLARARDGDRNRSVRRQHRRGQRGRRRTSITRGLPTN